MLRAQAGKVSWPTGKDAALNPANARRAGQGHAQQGHREGRRPALHVEAIETLASIMRHGESEAARVAATDKILDRAHGRPSQAVDLTGNLNVDIARTIEDMRERSAPCAPRARTDNGEAVSPSAAGNILAAIRPQYARARHGLLQRG